MDWDPTQFFRTDAPPSSFALLVLNQPINEKAFQVLREHANYTICADGGANRFYDLMRKNGLESTILPDCIIGDLDSIQASVRTHYEGLGVTIIQDPDQYSTDFTKSLKYLCAHSAQITSGRSKSKTGGNENGRLEILILGGLGGRVDQAFSQIHHLYLMTKGYSSDDAAGNLYLVSEESLTFVLQPGRNVIHTPKTNRPLPGSTQSTDSGSYGADGEGEKHLLEENVGIIPISGPARITTKGFQWDVEDWATEIGGQLSTSNHIRADVVEVTAEVPILFTMELAKRFKRVR
ncbi:hypothetical protein SI65_05062 [Aspergillus cristatus]|uniref:Thiamine pyrophosphokinase n=1 Tax=Aspergillus cristatus TaxID=573508 RepID=A0A1E3BI64_ASPCR|nr:hypothetical protein SI65_05062 [Aspergillus cristatus]